ncbi:hypothetical protein MRX96_038572 [Rhipicephalus microplus]
MSRTEWASHRPHIWGERRGTQCCHTVLDVSIFSKATRATDERVAGPDSGSQEHATKPKGASEHRSELSRTRKNARHRAASPRTGTDNKGATLGSSMYTQIPDGRVIGRRGPDEV